MNNKPIGVAVAGFVCGFVGFLINPCCAVTLATFILSFIALLSPGQGGKGFAIAGLLLGFGQIIWEAVWALFTLGISLFF